MSKQKSWHLNRRSFLRGAGVACALPYLEGMSWAASATAGEAPKRLCYVFFPNGCALPEKTDLENRQWRWFPDGEGKDYTFTNVLRSLEPYRNDLSIFSGLSHPKTREEVGHAAADTWLTAGDIRAGVYKNNASIDQIAAEHFKKKTRYPFLNMSAPGGIGSKRRVATLAFDQTGAPIPAENSHRRIFERYFASASNGSIEERRRSLRHGKKIVDLVLEDSRSFRQRLGVQDAQKMDAYLASLNTVEEQIVRNEKWLDVPMAAFDASHIDLDISVKIDPGAFWRSYFDLIVLAFQLDLTRVATFMMGREDGLGITEEFPKTAIGLKRGHHATTHNRDAGYWEDWGRYDTWITSQFAYFLDKMKSTTDEFGPLLDRSLVLYGSATSTTHDSINYPLLLAGGHSLGLCHGTFTNFDENKVVMSDLLLSMAQAAGVPITSFGDSSRPLPVVFG